MGVADVVFLDGALYAVLSGGGCAHGNAAVPNAIVKVDVQTGSWKSIADLSQFVSQHPTEYPDPVDAGLDPDGVFYGLIADRDRLYAVESNQGEVRSRRTSMATFAATSTFLPLKATSSRLPSLNGPVSSTLAVSTSFPSL